MADPTHFSSPKLSNWQSAVAKIASAPASLEALAVLAERPFHDFGHKLVAAAAKAVDAATNGATGVASALEPEERCAAAAFELAEARLNGDAAAEEAARNKFASYGTCDARWGRCVLEYVAHYAMVPRGAVPYVPWRSIDDFVEDVLPTRCRIAVLGDWGTGDARAQRLLEEVGRRNPDIVIHLGDVYYSCTNAEADRFLSNIRRVFPKNSSVRVLTLCGNHDMYSGGAPFYGLLNQLGQKASFFCLRNDWWQVLAGDTGYNDYDVREEGKTATWVRDYDGGEAYSELAWHHRRLTTAGARRTMLFTHHQPFSAHGAIDPGSAMNRRLHGQFEPLLGRVPLWIWGHEHNQVIYQEHAGVIRGRCIGASAVPVAADEHPYSADPAIKDEVPKTVDEASKLTLDETTGLYRLGFGLLDIDGERCTETYIEFDPVTGGSRTTFSQPL